MLKLSVNTYKFIMRRRKEMMKMRVIVMMMMMMESHWFHVPRNTSRVLKINSRLCNRERPILFYVLKIHQNSNWRIIWMVIIMIISWLHSYYLYLLTIPRQKKKLRNSSKDSTLRFILSRSRLILLNTIQLDPPGK